jgi:hypothetical protein
VEFLRRPKVLAAVGVLATLLLALLVVTILYGTGGVRLISDNAALIGALIALGGVFTTQMVTTSLEDQRARANSDLEDLRSQETKSLSENFLMNLEQRRISPRMGLPK